MQKYQNNVQSSTGQALAGVSVRVQNYPAGTDATIYSDNGITQAANPLTTDSNGAFSFYAANGHYSLQVSGKGIAGQTVSDVLLMDLTNLPGALPGSAGTVWNNGGAVSIS
ncbi:hypothetical protein R6138_04369 [Ralstonia thomasii]|jgi:hypothetical protein|uniref:carboxypeptidase-like regulatory domain-containing protein n=1 Tax=Ralstonia thomasii TaxID=3058596 RepID=UPI0028F4D036|nr:carboxypeptidase-like regulatory domain-containing protein [Ralstonia sp. LMG 18095]CAJ0899750.1 hypothetical protein R6138_04369 [Ralstonia sp. LMG 18095]